jgi:crotonobetainyl-CoA:carnitine CoA-transferase CaiB-like acyl-CoA transferase
MDTLDLFTDPHLKERGLIHDIEHDEAGPRTVMGNPLRMSGSNVQVRAAPLLGKHTDEVLAADLGLDAASVAKLRECGAIA